jgi:phage virion morphogenesis family
VKWADVSEKTKRRKNGRGGILVDHGHLLASITHEASADSVIIGSVMNYAAYLQEGTAHMPARPFLGLSDKDYRDIDHLLEDWLNGLIAP